MLFVLLHTHTATHTAATSAAGIEPVNLAGVAVSDGHSGFTEAQPNHALLPASCCSSSINDAPPSHDDGPQPGRVFGLPSNRALSKETGDYCAEAAPRLGTSPSVGFLRFRNSGCG